MIMSSIPVWLSYVDDEWVNHQTVSDTLAKSTCVFCGDWVTRGNPFAPLNRRSEANDLALRLAWQYTGNKDIITLDKWVRMSPNTWNEIIQTVKSIDV